MSVAKIAIFCCLFFLCIDELNSKVEQPLCSTIQGCMGGKGKHVKKF